MPHDPIPYPFAERTAYYRKLSDCALLATMEDAKEAWINQENIELAYGRGSHTGKDSSWRADDFHTILGVMNERKFKSPNQCKLF